jgi:glycosyltransferase involved in cell wall biosynthesis
LRRLQPAVVHTHHFGSLMHTLPAAWLARVPRVVHTEHAYQYLEPRADYRRWLRWSSAFTDAFVVVGRSLQDYYRTGVRVSQRRLRVIPNGIDTGLYRPARDMTAVRRVLGLPVDAFLIGTAGRFFPEKDYGTLIRAVGALAHRRPDIRLAMVGDGPERSALEALATSQGISDRVHFLGWRTDLPSILPALDVFVLSSRSEGLPLVALEALACEVPVVSTPVGDMPEVLADGQGGSLFPVADWAALAQALALLADAGARRRALGTAGRQRIVARYSREAMVNGYARVYEGAEAVP